MKRGLAGWLLSLCAVVAGIATAALSSQNRARGDELDQLQRWCEAQKRRNELQRLEIARDEWVLLGQADSGDPALRAPPDPERARRNPRKTPGAPTP